MTATIRRVATIMLLAFVGLVVNLNVTQLLRASDLLDNPANRRLLVQEYGIQRGSIVVGDQAIAHSIPTDDDLKHLRVYEDPELWAHLTGYYSFVLSRSGLERAYNEELTGTPSELLAQNLAELLGDSAQVGNTVRLTIDRNVQRAAREALGGRVGAVVALNPRTGAVIASYANPAYDPNPLSSHDARVIDERWNQLRADPTRPLVDRVTREAYAPGSTFKVVVAAAALERGFQPTTAFDDMAVYDVPQTTADISNFSPGPCVDGSTITLSDALRVSCNTVFAKLGVDLGDAALIEQAQRFGFNRTPPYDLPVAQSRIPKELDVPATAQSAIGERDVRVTPMQAAMLMGAIVNDGRLLRPYVVAEVLDPSGRVVRGPRDGVWSEGRFNERAVSEQTAAQLEAMLREAVLNGTGRRAAIDGVRVGGKTGTASPPGQTPTAWFVGYAEEQVVVAVVVPDAGEGATGGAVAAPIARAVMEAALG